MPNIQPINLIDQRLFHHSIIRYIRMMMIISDTSPLCYLILIDCIDVLPKLCGQVIVNKTVYQELTAFGTPEKVKKCCHNLPEWLIIHSIAKSRGLNIIGLLNRVNSKNYNKLISF